MSSLFHFAPVEPHHLTRVAVTYVHAPSAPTGPDDFASLERQRRQGWHARAWGWDDDRIQRIEDVGHGAADDRPGYQRLCQMVAAGEIGMVLVDHGGRLTQSAPALLRFFDLLRRGDTLLATNRGLLSPHDPLFLWYERMQETPNDMVVAYYLEILVGWIEEGR